MNNLIQKKPYLHNYKLALQLRGFFFDFLGDLSDYKYVSATERRCFNLAYYFIQGERGRNLLSNYGLLQYHKELALEYARTGDFSKIMVIDDLMVHGRGMSKFLYQLEALIEADLEQIAVQNLAQISVFEIQNFRHRLVQAVDIFIYARNERPLLLEDRYRRRIKSFQTLSERQMHDLSWQLSDSLTRWGIANTCFVYSEHNSDLAEYVVSDNQISAIDSKFWNLIHWKYDNESMGLFLRFYNQNAVRHVSSIRFFPSRSKELSSMWFTSFSMLGTIPTVVHDELCDRLKDVIQSENDRFGFLINLLSDRSSGLQRSRGQLLYFIISLIDYRSLCDSLNIKRQHFQSDDDVRKYTDVDKISRNFGRCEEVFPELSYLVCSSYLLEQIASSIYPILESGIEVLHSYPVEKSPSILEDSKINLVNDSVERIFYQIGIDAEENAKEWFENAHRFHPVRYQNYSCFGSQKKTDGVIALSDFHLVADQTNSLILSNLYCRTAALIAIMDYGVMGTRIHYAPQLESQFSLCKAGEMATFLGPKKMALAIPALTLLEKYCRRMAMTAKEAITNFCYSIDIDDIAMLINPDEIATWKSVYQPMIQELPKLADEFTTMMYRGGQSYQEWCFTNLTYRNDNVWLKCQWALEKQALIFLRLDNGAT